VYHKQLLNLTIKKLIGEATADELSALEGQVRDHPANAFFVNTITVFFNTETATNDEQNKRLFKRIKDKINP
jgi:hypothetical protein